MRSASPQLSTSSGEYSQQGSDLLDTGHPGVAPLSYRPSRVTARPFLVTNPQIRWWTPTSMKGSAFCFFFPRCFGPRDGVQTFLPISQGGLGPANDLLLASFSIAFTSTVSSLALVLHKWALPFLRLWRLFSTPTVSTGSQLFSALLQETRPLFTPTTECQLVENGGNYM